MADDTFKVIKSDTAIIPGWILYDSGLEHLDVRLWAILNASDSSTPLSYSKIADFFGCVRRTIMRSISRLESVGAIRVSRNQSQTNEYALWPFVAPGGDTEVTSDTEVTTSEDPTLYLLNKNVLSKESTDNFSESEGRRYARNSYPDEFNELWKIFPRKSNKPGAYKAYQATLKRGNQHSVLLAAVAAYAKLREGEDEKFTMHGSTFFGPNDRWQDFVEQISDPSADEYDQSCAEIYEQWDFDGEWLNPDTGEACFQNPSIGGYIRPRGPENTFVALDGTLYQLNASGARVAPGYWN